MLKALGGSAKKYGQRSGVALRDARFRAAGDGSKMESEWGKGIEALGRIGDAASEIATWFVMVVPIRIGGGHAHKESS